MFDLLARLVGGACAALSLGAPAFAQCAQWDERFSSPVGIDQPVFALAVFDDGQGPALYAGGEFLSAGGASAAHVARWDGATWSTLGAPGSGTNGPVATLQVFDDGSGPALYAGGFFTSAGGIPAASIARWNGTSWSALGPPGS